MKARIKNYLSVTKKEWNGMVVLIILIVMVLAAPYVYQTLHKDNIINFKDFSTAAATLNKSNNGADSFELDAVKPNTIPHYKKVAANEIIELNTADSAKLTELHGIGPSFARRIVKYRNRLGGFYSKEQLKEVYGVDSVKYAGLVNNISVNPARITKLHINTADFNQLRRFPYLTFKQIDAIVAYRQEHGNYISINDMKNIAIIDGRILRKIEPYLVFK